MGYETLDEDIVLKVLGRQSMARITLYLLCSSSDELILTSRLMKENVQLKLSNVAPDVEAFAPVCDWSNQFYVYTLGAKKLKRISFFTLFRRRN